MSYDPQFAAVIVRLFKGPLYDNEPLWNQMLGIQKSVNEYISRIGLLLNIHAEDGFAYIGYQSQEEDDDDIPRLIRRMPLSFEVSLLCVILREELENFDVSNSESNRLFLDMREIRERIRIYFKEKTDETRLIRQLSTYINKVESLGFLKVISAGDEKRNQEARYEVMRIIKARVSPEFLNLFKQKLEGYIAAL